LKNDHSLKTVFLTDNTWISWLFQAIMKGLKIETRKKKQESDIHGCWIERRFSPLEEESASKPLQFCARIRMQKAWAPWFSDERPKGSAGRMIVVPGP
jgi:hypothetical protein